MFVPAHRHRPDETSFPHALRRFRYVYTFTDQVTKWIKALLLKDKSFAVDAVQLFDQAVVIPSGLCLERARAGKGGGKTGRCGFS